MSDNPLQPPTGFTHLANGADLPADITEALAIVNAASIGGQPAILANLALANQIFNLNLAQQNAIAAQQAMYQLAIVTVGKTVDAISAADLSDPQAVDRLKELFRDFFDLLNSQSSANLAAHQEIIDRCLAALQAQKSPSGNG